jgi:hypothetical protein
MPSEQFDTLVQMLKMHLPEGQQAIEHIGEFIRRHTA